MNERAGKTGGIILTGENLSTRRKICPIAPTPTTNPTCTCQGQNI